MGLGENLKFYQPLVKKQMDVEITIEEIVEAIKEMPKGKTPDPVSILSEFYLV